MKLRYHDLDDSILSNWENEGGARAAALEAEPTSRHASDNILHSFGQSVVTHWNELPRGFRRAVFQEIAPECDEPTAGLPGLKEQAARFLHENSLQLLKRERRPTCRLKPATSRSSEKIQTS